MTLTVADAERFLIHEARLLDEARYEDWLRLFTADAWYWVPSQPGQTNPFDTVSLVYDDRRLLETRVRRLSNPNIHADNPAGRATRIVANVTVDDATGGGHLVRSKLIMVEYRRNRQRIFAATVHHNLVEGDGSLLIGSKRVDLVNCDAELEGLVLPF